MSLTWSVRLNKINEYLGFTALSSIYCTYIEPIVNQRWAKTGVPGEKPPDVPVQNLASPERGSNHSGEILVAKQILVVTINNVYLYKTHNNISFSIHCARNDYRLASITLFSGRNQYIWILTSTICFATMTVVWDQ